MIANNDAVAGGHRSDQHPDHPHFLQPKAPGSHKILWGFRNAGQRWLWIPHTGCGVVVVWRKRQWADWK